MLLFVEVPKPFFLDIRRWMKSKRRVFLSRLLEHIITGHTTVLKAGLETASPTFFLCELVLPPESSFRFLTPEICNGLSIS
jgi:hypothetical protein